MRIALIYLGRRGAGGWISLELMKQLQGRFPTLAVISSAIERRSVWVELVSESIITRTYHSALTAMISLLIPSRINVLARQIRRFEPDILIFPMFHPWNAILQKRLQEIPSVIIVHDPQPHPDLAGWFYGKLEGLSIRRAERCITLNNTMMDRLIQRGANPAKIDFIPLGPYRLIPDHELIPLVEDIPTILFFGRIVPYKGLEVLLQAYAGLRLHRMARLLIAGGGSLAPYRTMLANLPDVEIINHWITEDEFEKIFPRGDLLVLPYTSASQSGIIPIAASFGLPVIATRTGGLPEQVQDGVSGWLVKPDSKDELIAAITEALDNPEMARKRGKTLQKHYEDIFNWEGITLQVEESLKKAVQDRGWE